MTATTLDRGCEKSGTFSISGYDVRVYKTYPNLGVGEKKRPGREARRARHNASLWRSKRASWRGARRERVENSSLDALARSTRRLTPSRRLEGAIRAFAAREPRERRHSGHILEIVAARAILA